MSNFVDERTGRFRAVEMPTDLEPFPELAEATENARRLEREWQEAYAAHEKAKGALEAAIATDRAALAEAKLAGAKKLPAPKGVEAAKEALEEAERQLAASDTARRRAAEIVVDVLEQNRSTWVAQAEQVVEAQTAHEALTLTTYLEATIATSRARETAEWLRGFPGKRRYQPNATALRAEIVSELRIRAGLERPPPRTLPEQIAARRAREAEEVSAA